MIPRCKLCSSPVVRDAHVTLMGITWAGMEDENSCPGFAVGAEIETEDVVRLWLILGESGDSFTPGHSVSIVRHSEADCATIPCELISRHSAPTKSFSLFLVHYLPILLSGWSPGSLPSLMI